MKNDVSSFLQVLTVEISEIDLKFPLLTLCPSFVFSFLDGGGVVCGGWGE